MASRTLPSFAGSTYLAAADAAALDLTGNLYLSCFIYFTNSTAGFILGKATSSSYSYAFQAAGGFLSFAVSADGTAGSAVSSLANFSTGLWYFLEGVHDADHDLVRIALTPVTQAAPNSLSAGQAHAGGIHSGSAPFGIGGSPTLGYFIGRMHSVCLMSRIPSQGERELLYNGGAGLDYWELDAENRFGVAGFWSLKEASGSPRLDRSGNGLVAAETGGVVATTTRTYTAQPRHALYGPSHELRKLLAACEAWQDLVGATTETAAQARIYLEAVHEDVILNDKPNALIISEATRLGARSGFHSSGVRLLQIREDMAGGVDDQDAKILFTNRMGKIAEELIYHSFDTVGRLLIQTIDFNLTVVISEKENIAPPYQVCEMRIEFGNET